jgi:hypothetical protein
MHIVRKYDNRRKYHPELNTTGEVAGKLRPLIPNDHPNCGWHTIENIKVVLVYPRQQPRYRTEKTS